MQAGKVRGNIEGNTIGVDDGIADSGGIGRRRGHRRHAREVRRRGHADLSVSIVDNNIHDIDRDWRASSCARQAAARATRRCSKRRSRTTWSTSSATTLSPPCTPWSAARAAATSSQLGLALDGNTFDASDADFAFDAIFLDQVSTDAHYYFPGYTGSARRRILPRAGTASADLTAFWSASNTLVPPPFTFFGGVDASLVTGAYRGSVHSPRLALRPIRRRPSARGAPPPASTSAIRAA